MNSKLMGLVALAMVACSAAASAADAGSPTLRRIRERGELRVCIWPEYYGITYRNPNTGKLGGIDIELSAELASELNVKLSYVESSFAQLIEDVASQRCDVAMFAVGVLPQRQARLAFTQPYLQSDIYAVTTRSNRVVRQWADIDKPGVAVGVQAGTFMEPVMEAALKQAEMVVVRPPNTRERELEAGRIDVFMTDYPYSRRLLDNADWAQLVAPPQPFHVLPYAYATHQGEPAWLARLDEFVAAIKRDGRLKAAAEHNRLSAIVVK